MLASDLVFKEDKVGTGAGDEDFEDENDDDYGDDEDGEEGDYGAEGGFGADNDVADMQGDFQDETALIKRFQMFPEAAAII